MRISIRMLKAESWSLNCLSSHVSLISFFILHVSNDPIVHDDPFHEHRNNKRFSSIEIRVHFMEIWFDLAYSFVSALEIQSEILRCNQVCRYSKRERGWSVSRFAFDRPRLGEWAANSNTDGNHILRHHRYNFLNDAMESDIWLTGATTIRLDKSMKCSITNPRVRPRSIAYPRRF